ncbi:phosphonoacetaldehyde reductase [bacterium]|nr:phosphonoacetaldehyde reductase [bacterium]
MNSSELEAYFKISPVVILRGSENLDLIKQNIWRQRTLIVTSKGALDRELTKTLITALSSEHTHIYSDINPNPDIDSLDNQVNLLREHKFEHIIAIGGGSVIDSAKALAATLPLETKNPLAEIFRGGSALPESNFIEVSAIPTTSGTGSEVTPFATIWDKLRVKKHSLYDPLLFPKYALLIPELTFSLPRKETLYTALDSLSHALESIWNNNSSLITQKIAEVSSRLIVENLADTIENPTNRTGRSALQLSSLLSGIAISTTRTALAHSISYPLTAKYGIPHGLACGFTLLALLRKIQNEHGQILKDKALLISLEEMLVSFNLNQEIKKYAKTSEILACLPQMTKSDRAGNFFLNFSSEDISEIIKSSI